MSRLPGRAGGERLLLELDLGRGLLEAPPSTPLEAMRARHTPVLRALVRALERAAHDDQVAGLIVHTGQAVLTLAQSGELRAAIERFAASGKPTVAWSETYGEMSPGNVPYHLATACREVWLQPTGDLGLTGVVAEAVFVKDTLDKLGVETQIGQRYEYKTAANMYNRSAMTDAHREMATRLVESAMQTLTTDIAAARGLGPEAVSDAVAHAPLTAEDALARGLVDRLGYRDEVFADLRGRLGDVRLRYLDRYGKSVGRRASGLAGTVGVPGRPVVAVIQASGPILLGPIPRRSPLAGPSVGSDTLGAALRAAGRDKQVRAVVLRVDSPGGSYLASDAIRREMLALRRTGRPVVASMGSMAGSGGYYIAMPADQVLASPGTLTGSIGVLGGKQVIREGLARLGVQRDSVSEGRYAEMFSTQRPFNDDEWQRIEAWLDRVYDDFTGKAAQDRGLTREQVHEVARGRVWTGADAKEHRLVDELGGLSAAIDVACHRAGLRRRDVDVRALPRLGLLERLRPAESSEHAHGADAYSAARSAGAAALSGWSAPGASLAGGWSPESLLTRLQAALGSPGAPGLFGVPAYGVLTMPVQWQLR